MNLHRTLLSLVSALTLSLVACGPEEVGTPSAPAPSPSQPHHSSSAPGSGTGSGSAPDGGVTPEDPAQPDEPPPPSIELAARTWSRIDLAKSQVSDVANYAIDLAHEAAQASGSSHLITSGTLQQASDESWSYTATPADRLVVNWMDGEVYVVLFETLSPTGDQSGSAFMAMDHDLKVKVSGPTEYYAVTSKDQYSSIVETSYGQKAECTFQVSTNGSHSSFYDNGSVSAYDTRTTTGTIDCGAETASLDWTRAYSMDSDSISGVQYDTSESFHYSWQGEAGAYDLPDGTLSYSRDRLGPSRFQAGGTVYKDGSAVGQHTTDVVNAGSVQRVTEYLEVDGWSFDIRTENLVQ